MDIRLRLAALAATLTLALGTAAGAAEPVIYQLGWVPGGTNAIEYYALAKGYFAAEGLDVTIRSGNGATDTLSKVAAGAADIGNVGLDAALAAAAEQKVPAKVIYALFTKNPGSIHVGAGSGITTLADLAGKKIALPAYSSTTVTWPLFARRNGLDPDRIDTVKVDASALAPMLASGQVDAIVNWVTVAPLDRAVMAAAGREMVVIPMSEHGLESYSAALAAGDTFLEQRPEVARAFLRALAKATPAAIADPDGAAAAIHALVPEVDAAIAAQEFRAAIPLIENEVTRAAGLGRFDPAQVAKTWDWVAQSQGFAPAALDPMSVIDMSFVPE